MKKYIVRTLIVIICITLGHSNPAHAMHSEINNLLSFAKNVYQFTCKYPIKCQYGAIGLGNPPAHTKLLINRKTLETASKTIVFDEEYFDRLSNNEKDFRTLTAQTIQAHTKLDLDHDLTLWVARTKLENSPDLDPKDAEAYLLALNRTSVEEADAGLKQFPDLCLNQYKYFKNEAKQEKKELQEQLRNAKDPKMQAVLQYWLKTVKIKNPEKLKTLELGDPNPHPLRRALYFKQWTEEGGIQNK